MNLDGVNPALAHKVQALIDMSGGRITVQSGFRSVDRQQQLFDAAVKKYGSVAAARKWVAPPGHSNHNRGAAVDLGGDLALAHKLAPQLGLVAPMPWEAWHFELAGTKATSSPHAYTHAPDAPDSVDAPVVPDQDPHDVATQIGNFMSSIMGSTPDSTTDPTLDPNSLAYGIGVG